MVESSLDSREGGRGCLPEDQGTEQLRCFMRERKDEESSSLIVPRDCV